jgi:predicted neuraminidase
MKLTMLRRAVAGLMIIGLTLGLTAVATAADEVKTERVVGPEIPGKYKHPASIEQLKNGDLYIAYYGGDGEYAEQTAVYGMRQKKGETKWSTPKIIADTPFYSDGNAVIWQAPDGVAWLFYVCRFGDTWSTSRIKAKLSTDGAETWSDSFFVALEEGMMVRGRPIVAPDGDYLLPVYRETGFDQEKVGDDSVSLFLRFNPKTKKWSESTRIKSRMGNIQPAIAQVDGDYLEAYCRRGGSYEPIKDGYVVRSESRDGGRTWSEGKDSAFPNPNAAVDFLRLKNGHLLLVFNDNMNDRNPLTVAISTDGDKSYPARRDVATGKDSFAYPYVIQAADGKIHLVYTSHARTVINHAIFDESAILNSKKP